MIDFAIKYLFDGLGASPGTMGRLVKDYPPQSPFWDVRPDEDRLSSREILAHLATWEGLLVERLKRIREEENPLFVHPGESVLALRHGYATSDPVVQLGLWKARRGHTLDILRDLAPEEWKRCESRNIGLVSIEELAVLMLGHDGYHVRQMVEWLEFFENLP